VTAALDATYPATVQEVAGFGRMPLQTLLSVGTLLGYGVAGVMSKMDTGGLGEQAWGPINTVATVTAPNTAVPNLFVARLQTTNDERSLAPALRDPLRGAMMSNYFSSVAFAQRGTWLVLGLENSVDRVVHFVRLWWPPGRVLASFGSYHPTGTDNSASITRVEIPVSTLYKALDPATLDRRVLITNSQSMRVGDPDTGKWVLQLSNQPTAYRQLTTGVVRRVDPFAVLGSR
jgi:hypothetical protein